MKSYMLDFTKCEICGVIKMHEFYHDETTGKDFKICLKCDTKTDVAEKKEDPVLNSMRRW